MQQLYQPAVGDMSRIAKIAASCVVHKKDGTVGIASESTFIPVVTSPQDIQDGSPSMRGFSTICAATQQILLEPHHAKKRDLPSHDIATDMIMGSTETLIIFDPKLSESQIRCSVKARWCDKQDNGTYVLCSHNKLRSVPKMYIIGGIQPTCVIIGKRTQSSGGMQTGDREGSKVLLFCFV